MHIVLAYWSSEAGHSAAPVNPSEQPKCAAVTSFWPYPHLSGFLPSNSLGCHARLLEYHKGTYCVVDAHYTFDGQRLQLVQIFWMADWHQLRVIIYS